VFSLGRDAAPATTDLVRRLSEESGYQSRGEESYQSRGEEKYNDRGENYEGQVWLDGSEPKS
jgi:hypothetical protein